MRIQFYKAISEITNTCILTAESFTRGALYCLAHNSALVLTGSGNSEGE